MNDLNQAVNYLKSNDSANFSIAGTGNVGDYKTLEYAYDQFNHYCTPYVERYYPSYITLWRESPNKTDQAFKLVGKLMEKGIIKDLTLKKFIELVNEIAKDIL